MTEGHGVGERGQGRSGRKSWWRRRWLAAVVVVLVIAGGLGGWLMTRGGSSEAQTPTTVQVTSGTVKQTVSASGTVDAASTADLDFAVSGTVTKVYVAEGDKVRKGQALAKIDDDSLVATRDAAAASLTAAEEQLTDDEDAGASDVQIASDQSSVVSARSTLADAKQNVKDAVLRSTINGTVASLDLTVGDVVSGSSGTSGSSGSGAAGSSGSSSGGSSSRTGSSGSTGTASSSSSSSSSSSEVTVVSTNRFVVDATVSADDAPQVKAGMQATITVSGATNTIYGTVKSVGLVASASSSGAAVFPVTIDVTGTQKGLYAGTSATASITVKQRTNVLTVTSRAIRTSGSTTYVMKMVGGKAVKTPVTIGQVYGLTTEITKGLEAGDTVQVQGFSLPGGGSGGRTGRSGGGEGGGFSGGGERGSFPGGGSGGFSGGGFPGGGFPGGAS